MNEKHRRSRREALRLMGLGFAGFAAPIDLLGLSRLPMALEAQWEEPFLPVKPVTAIVLGAGARGNTYGNFAYNFPDMIRIVGVAEPAEIRRSRFVNKHKISEEHVFNTWEHVFERPRFADAVIITTPDDLHYGPCMEALEMGYHVLLEKPIAPTEQECKDILAKSQEKNKVVAVCHVLRYAPYFQKIKALLQSGAIGEIVSMQHFEPIEHVHMAHSFVRGNWHSAVETTPIILAKSCHDMDMIRWLLDQPCRSVAAYGGLKWFRKENAPEGSTARCMDGCAIEHECPYSAMKIYHRKRTYTYVFDLPEDKSQHGDAILQYLRNTNYGRCVYKMDNDQPDHYVCAMEFEKDITASFSMEAFTSYHGRQTRIMGSMGDIVGDMNAFTLTSFITGESRVYDNKAEDVDIYKNSGHGGGDWRLMHDWVKAVSMEDPSLLSSGIEASIESHLMAFAAEKSRLNGSKEWLRV
jgi:hypothetical protein